jgi:hypothetical protein
VSANSDHPAIFTDSTRFDSNNLHIWQIDRRRRVASLDRSHSTARPSDRLLRPSLHTYRAFLLCTSFTISEGTTTTTGCGSFIHSNEQALKDGHNRSIRRRASSSTFWFASSIDVASNSKRPKPIDLWSLCHRGASSAVSLTEYCIRLELTHPYDITTDALTITKIFTFGTHSTMRTGIILLLCLRKVVLCFFLFHKTW